MIKKNKLSLFFVLYSLIIFFFSFSISHASFIGVSPSVLPVSNCTSGLSCGLVGYWTFDGKDMVGGVARDRSGNGNNVNLINVASSTFYTLGKIGQGFNFDGSNDYLGAPILNPNSFVKITLSAWLKPSSISLDMRAVVVGDNTAFIGVDTSGNITSRVYDGANNNLSSSGVNYLNKWVHVVMTSDGQNQRLYVNGIQVSTTASGNLNWTGNTTITIGSQTARTNLFFNGIIDDVRIYNRGLSASEISQLYSSGASNKQNSASVVTATTTCSVGLSCGLVTYWSFDGKDIVNGVVRDNSGNGTFANMGNIASSTFYTTGVKGQALRFDSGSNYIYSDLGTARSTFTISLWYTPKVINFWNGNQTGFHMGKTAFNESTFFRWYSTGGFPKIQASSNNGGSSAVSSVYSSETRLPYLNTFVYTPTQIDWYINGVLYNSTTPSVGTFDAMRFIRLGGTGNASQGVNGVIDEFRVYDRALTVGEIKQLYTSIVSTKQSSSQDVIQNSSCISGLTCGLVGYWTFDGRDMVGGVARDRSGNGNNGNLISIATSTFYTLGKIGQSVSFDGTGKYINVGNTSSLSITTGSISSWFMIYGATRHVIVSKTDMNSNTNGYSLDIENNAPYKVNLYLEDGSQATSQVVIGPTAIEFNKWYHTVATWDGTTVNIYINGVLDTSVAQTTIPVSNVNNLFIGKDTNLINSKMNGRIDDLRIYNRAISATEVKQLYNLGK